MKKAVFRALGCAAVATGLPVADAAAALQPYIANDVKLVFDTQNQITWLQDANLLLTFINAQGYSAVTSAIVAASPTIEDYTHIINPFGTYHLQANQRDFMGGRDLGRVSWYGALAFAEYLNSIAYAGSTHWRLPVVTEVPVRDASVFSNLNFVFWTSQTDSYYVYQAWYLNTFNGAHAIASKDNYFNVWPVTNGLVSAVPAPGAVWLLLAGLPLVAGAARRSARADLIPPHPPAPTCRRN